MRVLTDHTVYSGGYQINHLLVRGVFGLDEDGSAGYYGVDVHEARSFHSLTRLLDNGQLN